MAVFRYKMQGILDIKGEAGGQGKAGVCRGKHAAGCREKEAG